MHLVVSVDSAISEAGKELQSYKAVSSLKLWLQCIVHCVIQTVVHHHYHSLYG